MLRVSCLLALLVVAKADPQERTFHLSSEVNPTVEVTPDGGVVAGVVKTHVLNHPFGSKKVEVAVKKVVAKPLVPGPVVDPATPAHPHVHPTHAPHPAHPHPTHAPHPAHVHPTHAPLVHPTHAPHVHPTHAPHPAHAHGHALAIEHSDVVPAAPLNVVIDGSSILVQKDKITEILKKLLSGAINKLPAHLEPLIVPPGGKPVAVIFSAGLHVLDLGTLQPLVIAQGAAVPPSYDPSHIKVEIAKLPEPYAAPAAKPVAVPAKNTYADPAAKAKTVVVTPAEYVAPVPDAETVAVEVGPAYEVVEVPSPAEVYTPPVAVPPPPPVPVVPVPDYAAPAEVEVAAVDAAPYAPVPLPLAKKVKKIVVAKDIY